MTSNTAADEEERLIGMALHQDHLHQQAQPQEDEAVQRAILESFTNAEPETDDTPPPDPEIEAKQDMLPSTDRGSRVDRYSGDECAICREKIGSGEHTRRLPCFHVFHTHEIEQWLERKRECPVCRVNVDTHRPQDLDAMNREQEPDTPRETEEFTGGETEEDALLAQDAPQTHNGFQPNTVDDAALAKAINDTQREEESDDESSRDETSEIAPPFCCCCFRIFSDPPVR